MLVLCSFMSMTLHLSSLASQSLHLMLITVHNNHAIHTPHNTVAGVPADERRISLSSIRAPRLGNAQRGQKDAPWAWEAKEWLR